VKAELDWREKECEAVTLKVELGSMQRSLEGARLGVLSHPQVGEMLHGALFAHRTLSNQHAPSEMLHGLGWRQNDRTLFLFVSRSSNRLTLTPTHP
jgi:hypothetical protein